MNIEELLEAYLDCRKNKRYTLGALAFEVNCEEELMALYRDVMSGTYSIRPSISFIVDHPVKREVFAADFRDRIIHHWLAGKLNRLFEKKFIYDSYACRKSKGTLFGVKRIKRFIARCSKGYTQDCYILRCDIRGFFMNIDRGLLCRMVDDFIVSNYGGADIDLVRKLTTMVIENDPIVGCHINSSYNKWDGLPADKSIFTNNGVPMPNGYLPASHKTAHNKGIPIGNLTSQLFANFYLNSFDHYMKHHQGEKYYGRYMDDFIIVHPSKEHLVKQIEVCRTYLKDQLKLQLHPHKIYLQHYSKGVRFLGVGIKHGALLTGQRTIKGAYRTIDHYNGMAQKRKLTKEQLVAFRQSLNSYWGLMVHHNSYKLRKKMANDISGWICNDVSYAGYRMIRLKKT